MWPPLGPVPWQAAWQAAWQGFCDPDAGGVSQHRWGGITPPLHVPAVVVRVFRPRPADPNRASGEGRDGSDPPFFAAGAARRGEGGNHTGSHTRYHTPPPPSGGVAPVSMYPCGKAPRPARGPDDQPRRAAPCLTASSARSWSSAASVSRAPGRGPARFPRPIPWRSWSATTPRTCTAPSSRGTTWRPAWPRSWPANFSSAHPGSGSPGWASVWGAGSAFRRGRFRLRPTGGGGVGAGIVGKGQSGRACAEPVSTRAWCWPDDAASDHGAGVRHGLRAAIDAVAGVRTPRAPATDDRGLV